MDQVVQGGTSIGAARIADGLPQSERLLALVAILIAVSMATLDTAIVNTALPTIARDIHTSAAAVIWVVSSYQIAMVATLLPLAALGEIFGHQRVHVVGLVVFTATSLACGLAWSLPTLVAARVLQGLGASMLMSQNTALIRFVYPSRMLGHGLGMNALIVGLAFTIGPTVASAVLSVTTWHWLFLINVPAGVLALVLSLRSLPRIAPSGHHFDPVDAVLNAAFFGLLIYAIGAVSQGDAWKPIVLELAAAALCFGLLLLRQRRAGHPAPMLPVDLFRLPAFALSSATAVFAFATQGLAFVSLPFLFQTVLGYSQVQVGFLMTPWPAIVAIMAPIAGRMSDRRSPGLLGGLWLAGPQRGYGEPGAAAAPPEHRLDHLAHAALRRRVRGFFQAPNLKAIMGSAPPGRSGGAAGIISTSRLVGQSTGAALVALCLNLAHERGPELALWTGCVFADLAASRVSCDWCRAAPTRVAVFLARGLLRLKTGARKGRPIKGVSPGRQKIATVLEKRMDSGRSHDYGGGGSRGTGHAAHRHDGLRHSAHDGPSRQWRRRHALHGLHGL